MLDNLGFGEFFALALMALLFFGPERLPQIGAKLGQWVRKLTGYSRSFMTEWSEEALVIRDAVKEVKGLRDEIVAAQAEIASTMDTTRSDVNEALDGAKLDVRQQVAGVAGAVAPDARGDLPAKSPSEYRGSTTSTSGQPDKVPIARHPADPAELDASGASTSDQDVPRSDSEPSKHEEGAIARTQQIVEQLAQKRAEAPSEYRGHLRRRVGQVSATSTSRHPDVRPADVARLSEQVDRIQEEMAALREAVARFRDDVVPADVAHEDEDIPAEIAPVVVEIAGEMR